MGDALLFAAILDDDVTAAAACAVRFVPFRIWHEVMDPTADPVSAIMDDGIRTVKAQQLFHVQ
jgi:hypothetical protein